MAINSVSRSLISVFAVMLVMAGGCADDPASSNTNPPSNTTVVRNARTLDVAGAKGTSVDVFWNAPVDSAGITGYRVWWVKDGQSTTDSLDNGADARSARLTGLAPNVNYTISIAAMHGTVLGPKAQLLWKGISVVGELEPPTNVAATLTYDSATGRLKGHVTWTASPSASITGYQISWKNSPQGDSGVVSVAAALTQADIPNLPCAQQYQFTVSAVVGASTSAPAVTAMIPAPTLSSPKTIRFIALDESTVKISWDASTSGSVDGYVVKWQAVGASTSDSVAVNGLATTLTQLQPKTAYRVQVAAKRCDILKWSGAIECTGIRRFGATVPIRLYEDESSEPPGLVLDPAWGGPVAVSVGDVNPQLGHVQLALYTPSDAPNTFVIGSGFAIVEYKNSNSFDRNTYISDSSFAAADIDAWYSTRPLTDWFKSPIGNALAFTFPALQATNGQVFFVRTGAKTSTYHFARVYIRNVGGRLLQGTAPNRFVELEIKYQDIVNYPYAKPAAGGVYANVGAQRRR